MNSYYRFYQNEDFLKDIKNLKLRNIDVVNKWNTSATLVGAYRKKLGISKPKYKNIAIGDTEQFEKDLDTLNIPELMNKWNIGAYTILRAREELGLTKNHSRGRSHLHKDDYINDLANPILKHRDISEKWKVSTGTVCRNRKQLGYGFWPQQKRSKLEIQFAELLSELDIAFIEQKQIGPYKPDFYLGHKICLDIHGRYIHSLEESKERDSRKRQWMTENNYIYLVFWEEHLQHPIDIQNKILNTYYKVINDKTVMGSPAQQCVIKKPCEP